MHTLQVVANVVYKLTGMREHELLLWRTDWRLNETQLRRSFLTHTSTSLGDYHKQSITVKTSAIQQTLFHLNNHHDIAQLRF